MEIIQSNRKLDSPLKTEGHQSWWLEQIPWITELAKLRTGDTEDDV